MESGLQLFLMVLVLTRDKLLTQMDGRMSFQEMLDTTAEDVNNHFVEIMSPRIHECGVLCVNDGILE